MQERGSASGGPAGLEEQTPADAQTRDRRRRPAASSRRPAPPLAGRRTASGWITDPTPPRRRSRLSTAITVVAVVIGVLVVLGIAGMYLGLFQPRGQVLFGTAAGPNLCSVGGETRTIEAGDPVFFAAVLRNRLSGDAEVRLTVTRDGEPFFDNTDPPDGNEFECYGSRESIGPLEPGAYQFEVTHDGAVEASGTPRSPETAGAVVPGGPSTPSTRVYGKEWTPSAPAGRRKPRWRGLSPESPLLLVISQAIDVSGARPRWKPLGR